MSVLYLVFLSLFIFCCNGDQHSMNMEECKASPESLINAINSTADYNLTVLIPNCLEYSDNSSSLTFGILSYQHNDGTTSGRYTVSCSNGILLLTIISDGSFRENTSSCYQCNRDETVDDPCIQGTECPSLCQYCIQSQCVHCTYAAYNGSCLRTCPSGRQPNASNGNQCECCGNFGGLNCTECQINESYCPNGTLFVENKCSCTNCPSNYQQILLDPYSTVPASVIGEPNTGEGESSESGSHEKRKRATDDHNEGESNSHESEAERTICVQRCDQNGRTNWRVDRTSGLCYACGITYCLDCDADHSTSCTLCRNGTLLRKVEDRNEYMCDGFYSAIRHASEELEHEEEHEIEVLDREKLELKILLPIICFLALVVYVSFGVIAHYRYPHIGHEKRHRDPKKKVTEDTENAIENKFRPQSTVRFR